MAAVVDISAPVCETREEQGEDILDQATSILISKLANEENDFSNVSNEDVKGNSTEHGEPRNVEICENESTEATVQKIESKIEKSEDHLHATSEDINAPEIETGSCIEEQSVTTHPRGILDEKTEDDAVDAAEKKGGIENVPTVVSIEGTEDSSLIQVGGPKMEIEDRLEKDAEQPSPVGDFMENIVTDEVKIDDRAESALLKEEVKKEKPLESLHVVRHLAEDPDSKQEESSITEVPGASMVISHENVPDAASLASEVVEEANSCLDKTVTEEIAALDDGSTVIPANGTLPETDPSGGTEAEVQVPDEVKIDDRAEFLEEEDTESALLKKEVQKEKPLESLHVVRHLAEDPDSKQEESSITEVPGASMVISHENVPDAASLASEVVEEANSCLDKTVTEEIAALDDGSTVIPANGTLPETDPSGGTEAEVQVPDEVKIDDRAEFLEEEDTESALLKKEVQKEKPLESLHVVGHLAEDPDSKQEESSITEVPEAPIVISHENVPDAASLASEVVEEANSCGDKTVTEEIAALDDGSTVIPTNGTLPETDPSGGTEAEVQVPDEVKIDDRAEFLEEEDTESALLKEEVKKEEPLESFHVVGHLAEDPDSKQEESSITEVPEAPMVISHENVPDAASLASEVVEEANSCGDKTVTEEIAALDDGSTLIPTNETLPETDPSGGTEAEVQVPDEVKIDDRAEFLEEEDTESALLKKEVQKEKPLESLHAETTSLLEEKNLTENPQETLCEETEEKTIDVVSNEDNSKDSLIQVDAREMEQGAYLEKEDTNQDESINLVEPKIGNECNEDFQNASEDHKASASSEDIETTLSHKEENLVMSDNTIGPNNTEEATHENVTAEIQHVHMEENSVTLVDSSQIEQEQHLEKDGENSSWTEAPIEEAKADESRINTELEGIDSMKAELENEKDTESISVKEEAEVDNRIDSLPTANQDTEASDSTQDTNKCTVEQLPTATPEELSSNQTEKESVDAAEAKEESHEDIARNVPDGDNADNTPIEEDGSQEPLLEDAKTDNNNAEELTVAYEAKPVAENEKIAECTSAKEEISTESSALGQDEEPGSLEEKSLSTNPEEIMDDTKEDKTNGAIVAEEETPEDEVQENIGKTTTHEDIEENSQVQEDYLQLEQKKDLENDSQNTSSREVVIGETTEGSLDNKEAQVPTEDKASESCQETYSIEEKVLSADPEEIPCDKTEETTADSAYTKNEIELQNVENVPNEGSGNSQTEVEGPQKTSSEETSIGNNNDAESTITCDAKFADENIVKADFLGNEESTECALVKEEVPLKSLQEEAQEEKPIDSSQAAREEIKASDSSQETNCYIEEKSLPMYPQEISSDKTERESIDAISRTEESTEDIPDGDDAVNPPIEEDGSQKPYLKEATTRNDEDDGSTVIKEAKLVSENEKDIESTLVTEEVSTALLQVAAQDAEVTVLGQDRETSSLEVQSDETKEDKTSDTTGAEEETPADKDVATTPCEGIEENLPVEVDCKQVEQNEDLVNVSENTSLTEALTGNTGEKSLVKEEAHEEKHSESLEVATEDVQASDSCQETGSVEEKILMDDPQEISCDIVQERTIDAAYTKKENLEEVAPEILNVSDEDNSPIQVDGLQKPPPEEALSIIHEAKFAEESKVEADLFQNETKTECGLAKEEVSMKSLQVENEDIKPTASSEDREISHLKEQGLTTNPQEIVGDYREDKTIDVTELKEEALKDKSNATTSNEDTTENSLIQVDCIQLEENETLEKANESTSLSEAPTEDTTENILVKEKAEEEDHHIETLQVATEDMKESASCKETSSIEEQILTDASQETSCDKTEEKTTDSAYTEKESFEDVEANVPRGDSEDCSPIKVDGSQKPSLKEASTENTYDHESTIQHDTKFTDDLSENEKIIECDLTKEDAPVKSLDVQNEDTKANASNQDRETGHKEEQDIITNPQGIMDDHTEDEDLKEVTHEDKSYTTISYEDTTENSSVHVDCSNLKQSEHSEKDNELTSSAEALATDTRESNLFNEEAQNEDHTEVLKVATEDIKAFSPCQDTETSSTEEQVLILDPENISREKTIEKTIDASDNEKTTDVQVENEDIKETTSCQEKESSHLEEQGLETNPQGIIGDHKDKTVDVPYFKEENHEDMSYATTSYEDSGERSSVQVDCSQLEQNEYSTEAPAADTIGSTSIKEEAGDEDHIESLHSATEDVEAFSPCQEEQILTVDPEDISRDKTIENTVDASDKEKTLVVQEKNTEGMLKEDAYAESSQEATDYIKASNSCEDRDAHSQEDQILSANPEGLKDENKEGEPFHKDEVPKEIENIDFEARNIELKEEKDYLKDMPADINIAVHEEKDSDSVAVKTPCTENLDVVEEVAVRHLADDHDSKQEESSITEVPEVDRVIAHENIPDVASLASEVVEEANSCGSTMIPTNETLPETDPRGCTETEVQVPDGEKEAELVQHDLTTETDQKDIEGQLLIKDSQVILESEGVNDEEEKTNSDNCKEKSGSSNSGALEDESTSNFQEYRREMKEGAENEEAQKQEELHVSELVHDAFSGKIENHVQELEKAPLPSSDENIIETTECNVSETVEDAIKYKEGDDRTESFFDEKKATEREQEEAESEQEKSTSDENVQTTTSTSDLEVIDVLPVMPSETSKVDLSSTEGKIATDREELNAGKIASDAIEDTRIDNNRSITDLESINDDEAAEIIQTTSSATEGQDVESTMVGETTSLITECHRDGYEHDDTSSATEESPDSKEVVLESVSQVAETEETKKEEKNLETVEEIESEKVVAEDISGQEESKHETEILKTKEENKDVLDYHQACHQEEVIIGSHLGEEANLEEICTGFEDIKKENETEEVMEIPKAADEKAFEEPEETLLGKESIDRGIAQKEQSENVQEVTTAIETEEAQALGVAYVKIGAHNSNEEINMSTAAFPGEEEKRTGANDTENEIAENITCESPTHTFDKTIDDPEVKKEQQEEPITRKHEILPLPELVQDKDSEKHNQKDEICGLDEVQPRDEENVTHSEEKSEESKGDTWSKAKEVEETETHFEPEQFDFSFHVKDISEVPIRDDAQVTPEDAESHITRTTSPDEECSNKSTLEVKDQQAKLHDLPEELNITDTLVMAGKDDPENLQNDKVEDTAQPDKFEESPRQIDSLSILPEVKCSEIETTESDIPVHSDGVNGTCVAELEITPLPSTDKHIVLEADQTTVLSSENAKSNEKLSTECSQSEHDLLEPSKVEQKEADCGNEERADQETAEKPETKEADKPSLSDLLSVRETSKVAVHSSIGEEPTTHADDRHAEKSDEDHHENAKTEGEHDDKAEQSEQKVSDSSSEAPVMVEMADADVKVSHKKSHNILSGVGSKVKHSIAKVKKVITGKSSHPKPPSPKKYTS